MEAIKLKYIPCKGVEFLSLLQKSYPYVTTCLATHDDKSKHQLQWRS